MKRQQRSFIKFYMKLDSKNMLHTLNRCVCVTKCKASEIEFNPSAILRKNCTFHVLGSFDLLICTK